MLEVAAIRYFFEKNAIEIKKRKITSPETDITVMANDKSIPIIVNRDKNSINSLITKDEKDLSEEDEKLLDSLPFDKFIYCSWYRGEVIIFRYCVEHSYDDYSFITVGFDPINYRIVGIKKDGKIDPIVGSDFRVGRKEAARYLSNMLSSINKCKKEKHIYRLDDISFMAEGDKSRCHPSGRAEKVYILGRDSYLQEEVRMTKTKSITRLNSWVCCGHWRKLQEGTETIGKDRFGNRVIKGMTWVKECTKGDGEIINSIRVIK